MAHQRWSESRRHRLRGGARGRGLAGLIVLTLALAACDTDPAGPPQGLPSGSTTTAGDGAASAALVGTWRTVTVIDVPGDIQTWTTTWRFDAAGTCHQTVVIVSLAEGVPRTTERACTWRVSDGQVVIAFTGAGTLAFDFSFAGHSSDRLVLDGFEYQRVA